MSLLGIIDVIKAALQFPDALTRFINVLRATPQETHDRLVKQGEDEAEHMRKTGRPSWG